MKDELVSFELAKLAKEKRFDYKTLYRYQGSKDCIVGGALYNHNDIEEQKMWNTCLFSAPTQSLLQRWLREVHNINLIIECFKDRDDLNIRYRFIIYTCLVTEKINLHRSMLSTYEEALEQGLQEALKLIP